MRTMTGRLLFGRALTGIVIVTVVVAAGCGGRTAFPWCMRQDRGWVCVGSNIFLPRNMPLDSRAVPSFMLAFAPQTAIPPRLRSATSVLSVSG